MKNKHKNQKTRKTIAILLVILQLFVGWSWIGVQKAQAAPNYAWEKYSLIQKPQFQLKEDWSQYSSVPSQYAYISGYSSYTFNKDTGAIGISGNAVSYSNSGPSQYWSNGEGTTGQSGSTEVYQLGNYNTLIKLSNYYEQASGNENYTHFGNRKNGYISVEASPIKVKGVLLGIVTGSAPAAYPNNGEKDGYWYVYKGLNNAPAATVSNSDIEVSATSGVLMLEGTLTDQDHENVTVSATIDGVEKSTTLVGTSAPRAWTLSWNPAEIRDGSYNSILVTVTDSRGGSNSYPYIGMITVDRTLPTAPTISVTPTFWSNGSVRVEIENGKDDNFKATYYSTDGGSTFSKYAAPFEITKEGTTPIVAYSEDAIGNMGPKAKSEARIVLTAPTTPTLTLENLNWTNEDISFFISNSSSAAPLEYEYKIGEGDYETGSAGNISGTGNYVITARARDAAGLLSEEVTGVARIDREPSEIQLSENGKDWSSDTISVEVNAKDEHSGIKTIEYAVTQTEDEPDSWSAISDDRRISMEDEGIWYLHVRVFDLAGNKALFTSEPYKIQMLPRSPTSEFLTVTPKNNTEVELEWQGPSTSVTDGYTYTVRNTDTHAEYSVAYPELKITDHAALNGAPNHYELVVRNHVGSVKTTASALTYPGTPANLQAQAINATGENMSFVWDEVVGADAYNVVVRSSLGGGVVFSDRVIDPAVRVTGLSPGMKYITEISALNATGEGVSSTIGFLTLPDRPGHFHSIFTGNDAITLGWSPVESALSYLLYGHNKEALSVTETTYTDSGLEAGTDYSYSLAAVNEAGEGEQADQLKIRTLPAKDETLRLVDVTSTSLTAEWSGVKNADAYEVQLLSGNDMLNTVKVSEKSASFAELIPGRAYAVKLTPVNESGSGESTLRTTTTVPDQMPETTAVNVSETSATFDYAFLDGATHYKFTVNGETYVTASSPYTLSALQGSNRYLVQIQAGNAQGYGEAITVEFLTKPKAPTGLNSINITENSVTVGWNQDDSATGYRVRGGNGEYEAQGTAHTFTNLEPGKVHTLYVKTINTSGEGEYASLLVMTKPEAPLINVKTTTATTVVLEWESVIGADRYEVVSDDESAMYYSGIDSATELQSLEDGKRYHFRAYAVNAYGLRSEPIAFTAVTRVADLIGLAPMSVASDEITVKLPDTNKEISEYIVQRNGETITSIPFTDKEFSDKDIKPNTSYTYNFVPVNEAGEGSAISFEVITPSLSVSMDSLNIEVSDTSFEIEFKESEGAKAYIIYEDGIVVVRGTASPIKVEDLNPGTKHYYTLIADNDSGYLSKPAEFEVMLLPANLTERSVNWISDAGSVSLIFNGGVPEGMTYLIKDRAGKIVGEVQEGESTYKLVPLSASTIYTYTILAKNEVGESLDGLVLNVETQPLPPKRGHLSENSSDWNVEGPVAEMPEVKEEKPQTLVKPANPVVTQSVTTTVRFIDTASSFASAEINMLANQGVIKGITADRFEPTHAITRIEFAALVVRALQLTPEKAITLPYQDIEKSAWYTRELQIAVSKEIAQGFSQKEFGPNRNINREQATRMLVNAKYGNTPPISNAAILLDLSDVSIWARSAVEKAVFEGLVQGYPDGTFKPAADMTRAEAAMMIYRLTNE